MSFKSTGAKRLIRKRFKNSIEVGGAIVFVCLLIYVGEGEI
jgi:hypothetical protein